MVNYDKPLDFRLRHYMLIIFLDKPLDSTCRGQAYHVLVAVLERLSLIVGLPQHFNGGNDDDDDDDDDADDDDADDDDDDDDADADADDDDDDDDNDGDGDEETVDLGCTRYTYTPPTPPIFWHVFLFDFEKWTGNKNAIRVYWGCRWHCRALQVWTSGVLKNDGWSHDVI